MLYAALHCYLTQYNSTTSMDILQNLYVDNILSECSTEEESLAYYNEARTTLSEANFILWSWASNSNQLCATARQDHTADNGKSVSVLGLVWNTIDDTLILAQRSFDVDHPPPTKPLVLQQSSKSFDSLGIVSPVTI